MGWGGGRCTAATRRSRHCIGTAGNVQGKARACEAIHIAFRMEVSNRTVSHSRKLARAIAHSCATGDTLAPADALEIIRQQQRQYHLGRSAAGRGGWLWAGRRNGHGEGTAGQQRQPTTGTGTATRTRRHEDTRTATRARGEHDRNGARRAEDCREGLRRTASSNSFFASESPAMSSHFTCRHPIHGKKATRRGAFSSRAARDPGFHSKNRPKTRKAVKYREEGGTSPPL